MAFLSRNNVIIRTMAFSGPLAALLLLTPAEAGAPPTAEQPLAASEYEVKAEFLHRFSQFVVWPPEAFASSDAPLTIGVLGQDPFGPRLEAAVADARVAGRSFAVRRFKNADELTPCHILFIAGSEEPRLAAVLERVKGTPTLTIGETRRFAKEGGAIGFVLAAGRVRFEINPASAEKAGLKVSSHLLKLAKVVR